MLLIRLRYWHLMTYFMWMSFKFHLPAAPTGHVILDVKDVGKRKIPLVQPWYHFCRKWVGPRAVWKDVEKLHPLGFDPHTVHPRASHCTKYAIPNDE